MVSTESEEEKEKTTTCGEGEMENFKSNGPKVSPEFNTLI